MIAERFTVPAEVCDSGLIQVVWSWTVCLVALRLQLARMNWKRGGS